MRRVFGTKLKADLVFDNCGLYLAAFQTRFNCTDTPRWSLYSINIQLCFLILNIQFYYFILSLNFLFSPEFIEGVSQFSVKGDKESKLRCKCLMIVKIHLIWYILCSVLTFPQRFNILVFFPDSWFICIIYSNQLQVDQTLSVLNLVAVEKEVINLWINNPLEHHEGASRRGYLD